jgi:dolichyl-phosphate beta-glucosyltransferase
MGQNSTTQLPVIVVPCFNEEQRLDVSQFRSLAQSGRLRLLFVNDGSTDATTQVLTGLTSSSPSVEVLDLPQNVGKAEAVRRGLLHGIDSGASVIGYYDADLATPPQELLRLIRILDTRPDLAFVMAARVALLGRTIERSPVRHYLGRVFASLASIILRLRVYDTQCGAKVFRVTPAVVESISRPFRSSWVFDVELIGRMLQPRAVGGMMATSFEEVPLREWRDISGSKLGVAGMVRAFADLMIVGIELNRRSRTRGKAAGRRHVIRTK